jgi:hypothetical protein
MLLGTTATQAECTYFDNFVDNGDGTVTDPRDGLVWQKCPYGQTWSGSSCEETQKGTMWWAAMIAAKEDRFLGKSDWRLPTKSEMEQVVGNCSADGQRNVSSVLEFDSRLMNKYGGFSDYDDFWTSTPDPLNIRVPPGFEEEDPHFATAYYYWFTGKNSPIHHGESVLRVGGHYVRFVRAGLSENKLEFKREYGRLSYYDDSYLWMNKLSKYKFEETSEMAEAKKREAAEQEQAKREEAERPARDGNTQTKSKIGNRVCSTFDNGKNGWCGYITQILGESVRVENYTVFCNKGGLLGVCTNIGTEGNACNGNTILFVNRTYENPNSIIVPISCLD